MSDDRRHRAAPTRRSIGDVLTATIAELLIIGGIGAGLFVGYTAWWTDVVAGAEHSRFVRELGQATTKPGGVERRTTPPLLDQPGAASVFGTMQIPRFGTGEIKPIGQGTDRATVLNTIGLGHYEDTAMPGGSGNFAVAGHRVTYGKPLNRIAELRVGDPIVTRVTDTAAGFDVWYVYRVTGSRIVTPDQVAVIAPVPGEPERAAGPDDRTMTLTACHPMWSAAERYVVHADFDYWMPASDGTPKELDE
jgi:sortase A